MESRYAPPTAHGQFSPAWPPGSYSPGAGARMPVVPLQPFPQGYPMHMMPMPQPGAPMPLSPGMLVAGQWGPGAGADAGAFSACSSCAGTPSAGPPLAPYSTLVSLHSLDHLLLRLLTILLTIHYTT